MCWRRDLKKEKGFNSIDKNTGYKYSYLKVKAIEENSLLLTTDFIYENYLSWCRKPSLFG